ncbi:hypothetical protein HDU93_005409 [Gonapodya sp. JEL0774]|nr:hypothetical protein HDU93_005409 [Gonapodya sp. JEL0774]
MNGVGRLSNVNKSNAGKVWAPTSPITPSPLNPKRRLSNTAPIAQGYQQHVVSSTVGPPTVRSPVSMLASNPYGSPRPVPATVASPPPVPRSPVYARASSVATSHASYYSDVHFAENPFSSDTSSVHSAPSPPPNDTLSPEPEMIMEVEEWIPGNNNFDIGMFMGGASVGRVSPLQSPRTTTPVPYNNSGAAAGGVFTYRAGSPRSASPMTPSNPYAFDSVRTDSPVTTGHPHPSYASYAASRFSPTSTSDSGESTDSGLGPRTPPPPLVKAGIIVPPPKQPIPAAVFHVTFHPPADGRVYAIEEYFPSGTLSGEIALSPGDRVEVYEIVGQGVVKGLNVDTGEEGVFPEWALGRGQAGRDDRDLVEAVEAGETLRACQLLLEGADPHSRKRVTLTVDIHHTTLLQDSSSTSRPVTRSETVECESVLGLAIMHGHVDIVEQLLKMGANPNAQIEWSRSNWFESWTPKDWLDRRWRFKCSFPSALSLAVGRGGTGKYFEGYLLADIPEPNGALFVNLKGGEVMLESPATMEEAYVQLTVQPKLEIVNLLLKHGAEVTPAALAAAKKQSDPKYLEAMERHVSERGDSATPRTSPSIDIMSRIHALKQILDDNNALRQRWNDLHDAVTMFVDSDFEPTSDDEITLRVGDNVRVVDEYADGWCLGINNTTQALGYFPLGYLSPADADPMFYHPSVFLRNRNEQTGVDRITKSPENSTVQQDFPTGVNPVTQPLVLQRNNAGGASPRHEGTELDRISKGPEISSIEQDLPTGVNPVTRSLMASNIRLQEENAELLRKNAEVTQTLNSMATENFNLIEKNEELLKKTQELEKVKMELSASAILAEQKAGEMEERITKTLAEIEDLKSEQQSLRASNQTLQADIDTLRSEGTSRLSRITFLEQENASLHAQALIQATRVSNMAALEQENALLHAQALIQATRVANMAALEQENAALRAQAQNARAPEPPRSVKKLMFCIRNFNARGPDELELRVGDEIYVKLEYSDGWGMGINMATEASGYFPFTCVSSTPIAPAAPGPALFGPPYLTRHDSREAAAQLAFNVQAPVGNFAPTGPGAVQPPPRPNLHPNYPARHDSRNTQMNPNHRTSELFAAGPVTSAPERTAGGEFRRPDVAGPANRLHHPISGDYQQQLFPNILQGGVDPIGDRTVRFQRTSNASAIAEATSAHAERFQRSRAPDILASYLLLPTSGFLLDHLVSGVNSPSKMAPFLRLSAWSQRAVALVVLALLALESGISAQIVTYNKCKCSADSPCYVGGVYLQAPWCFVDSASCSVGVPYNDTATGRGWDLCPADASTTRYTIGLTASPSTITSTSQPTPTSSNPSAQSSQGSSGLSTTAIVGIAIGVVAGVAAIAAVGLFAVRNRRKSGGSESGKGDHDGAVSHDVVSTADLHAGTTTPLPGATASVPPRPATAWSVSSAVTAFGAFGGQAAAVENARANRSSKKAIAHSGLAGPPTNAYQDVSSPSPESTSTYVPNVGHTPVPYSSSTAFISSHSDSHGALSFSAPAPSITSSLGSMGLAPRSSFAPVAAPAVTGFEGGPSFVAMEAYTPQYPGDLKLSVGDGVEVEHRFGDGWARGKNTSTGEVGVFPEGFVGIA